MRVVRVVVRTFGTIVVIVVIVLSYLQAIDMELDDDLVDSSVNLFVEDLRPTRVTMNVINRNGANCRHRVVFERTETWTDGIKVSPTFLPTNEKRAEW